MKQLLLLATAMLLAGMLVLLTNCKRESEQKFTISGRVLDSCHTRNPVANVDVNVSGGKSGKRLNDCNESFSQTGTTDKDGKFSITYSSKCSGAGVILQILPSKSVNGQLIRGDLNIGDIVLTNNTRFKVVVETDTAYSANDTLFYLITAKDNTFNADSTYKFIAGPFANKQVVDVIDSTFNFSAVISGKNIFLFHRWILKTGTKVYKSSESNNMNFLLNSCGQTNEVLVKMGK